LKIYFIIYFIIKTILRYSIIDVLNVNHVEVLKKSDLFHFYDVSLQMKTM